jgi:IrrE N-terminal-like domain
VNRAKPGGYSQTIDYIRRCIPKRIDEQIRTDWFCETDPIFAGLHNFEDIPSDGRSYRNTAHTVWPEHQLGPRDRKQMTIVLPKDCKHDWYTVLHELGHVLHHRLGNEHVARPVTDYAETNHREAFAEAFSTWIIGASRHPACRYELIDKPTLVLFDGLWR